MHPTEQILTHVRESLALLDEADGQFDRTFESDHRKFRRADELQVRGFLHRLLDTAIGDGISEMEAELLAKLVTASHGMTLRKRNGDDGRIVTNDKNPFMHLLHDLRRYSLVKRDAIHVEIHQSQLPVDRPVELNSEALDVVYDALSTRIDKLAATGRKGGLFLKEVLSDKTSSVNPRTKFEAVLRIIDLGAAEDLPLQIFKNSRYHEALSVAQDKAEEHGPLRVAAEEMASAAADIERGNIPRRGFFRAMSEAVIGAAIAPVIGPAAVDVADKIGINTNAQGKIDAAMRRIKELRSDGAKSDKALRQILEDVARESMTSEAVKGVAIGGLTYYIANQNGGQGDPLNKFLTALANECDQLQYPVFQFGTSISKSSRHGAASRG